MPRYFLEVAYKGSRYSGFQEQPHCDTIQGQINRALQIILKQDIVTTTSSRTDAGVHALQNYLHFDAANPIPPTKLYNLNALLTHDIVIHKLIPVAPNAHARFDALSRKYAYHIFYKRNPFMFETGYYLPFKIDFDLMQQAAGLIMTHTHFESFSKKRTDVRTFECKIFQSYFEDNPENSELVFHVEANRFLRGMVRALTGTLIQVGRKKITPRNFEEIILSHDCTRADFSVPAQGLFLEKVNYPESVLNFQTENI